MIRTITASSIALFLMTWAPSAWSQGGDAAATEEPSLALMLLFAFVGGIILNVMPCVLPVLSIKILGLVQQAEEEARTIWFHGVAYAAGILLSFGALGVIIIALQSSGSVGWGFQFQNPAFVAILCAIVFAFGLNLFGVFEVSLPGAGRLDAVAASRHGYTGSFLNGVFATVLATPCTAPFMAPALGFALSQPPAILMVALLTLGLGLAFPFLLLAAMPGWARLLPKPGPWMITFKKGMGFLLIATAVWLVDVLSYHVPRDGLIGFLAFLAVLGLAAWVYGHWGAPVRSAAVRWMSAIVAVSLVGGGSWAFVDLTPPPPEPLVAAAPLATAPPGDGETPAAQPDVRIAPPVVAGEIAWVDFLKEDVEAMARSGKTVFIDFTAAWCVTCKAFEKAVINTDPIKTAFTRGCVVPVKADFTREDPTIQKWLDRFKRPGVPMYLIVPANRPDEIIKLPDALTAKSLLDGLEKAGPTTAGPCVG